MRHLALGVGYIESEHETVRREWQKYNVDFHFVGSIAQAIRCLKKSIYVCVFVYSDNGGIDNGQLDMLRRMKSPPILLFAPQCSIEQRVEYIKRGAVAFILNANQQRHAENSGKDAVRYYLEEIPKKNEEPLTIFTYGDLYFCLEYRRAEVRGQQINLTPKEFDIMALMISYPMRVFTYEMITELVWNEVYDHYSRKAIISHVNNLRNKLRVQPDVPDYIVSIRGVGYKFDIDHS